MEVEQDGHTVAKIKKALITPLRARYAIELDDGAELSAKGNIVDHEYAIKRGGEKLAHVSKRCSGCATPTGSTLPPARTRPSSSPRRFASTRWRAAGSAQHQGLKGAAATDAIAASSPPPGAEA
jgi:hypothetical protein